MNIISQADQLKAELARVTRERDALAEALRGGVRDSECAWLKGKWSLSTCLDPDVERTPKCWHCQARAALAALDGAR